MFTSFLGDDPHAPPAGKGNGLWGTRHHSPTAWAGARCPGAEPISVGGGAAAGPGASECRTRCEQPLTVRSVRLPIPQHRFLTGFIK